MGGFMKKYSAVISILVLLGFMLSVYLNVFIIVPQVDALNTLNKFDDESTELVASFPGTSYKEILIPAEANVTMATVDISTMEDGGDYPENIQLFFGDSLPLDWAYRGEGHGAYGQQEYFSKGQLRVNLSYDEDKINDTIFFYLPKNANIDSASVKLTGFEYDYWENWIKEVNHPDTRPYSWQQDPMPFEYQNRLWVFYRTYNQSEADASDADICYNYSTDGMNWLPSPRELTPSPDTPTPYPASNSPFDTHLFGDFHPAVTQFNSKMGVFWGSASDYNTVGNGLTNGTDRDIVCQWYDGSWDNVVEITAPNSNANETPLESSNATYNYTRNPGPDPWGKDDRRPYAASFNGKVYVVWSANNTGNTTFHMNDYDDPPGNDTDFWWEWGRRGDILISSSSDGETWSRAMDLTAYDEWHAIDFAPSLNVFNGKLYCIWETNGRYCNDTGVWRKKVDVENRFDFDIVYRYTSDGTTWSDYIELTPENDTADGETHVDFSYPDEDPRLVNYYDPVKNENRMYAVWRTRNPKITNGTDYDIYLQFTTDGLTWTKVGEMTAPENGNFDNKPELTVFDNKLYVVWRRLQGPRWEDNSDGDIVTRHWDGKEWSVLQEITPWDGDGTGNDDFYANSIVFRDKFYTFWSTRNRGKGWPEGTDADVVYRRMEPSNLPIDVGLEIGNGDTFKSLVSGKKLSDASPSIVVDDSYNFKKSLNDLMGDSTYVANNIWEDSFGNEMVTFRMKLYIGQPGRVRVDDLNIKYTCTMNAGDGITKSPDVEENPFREKINVYLENVPAHKIDQNGDVKVKLQVTSAVKGKVKLHNLFLAYNMKPSLEIIDPKLGIHNILIKKKTMGEYNITWIDQDIDDDADISLYYHQVGEKKSAAKLIVDNIKENDPTNKHTWKFTKEEAPTGSYRIFGRITDGIDQAETYAPGIINITWEKQYPPWIKIDRPIGKNEKAWEFYKIKWQDYDANSEDNAKINLYYSLNYSDIINITQIDIDGNGEIDDSDFIYEDEDGNFGEFDWNITWMKPGSAYYIVARIDDGYNTPVYNYSKGRVIREYINSPQNITLVEDVNDDPDIWETHILTPHISWRMDYTGALEYIVKIWLGTSSAGTLIFEKIISDTTLVVDATANLKFGETYYVEVYAISDTGALSEVISMEFSVINRLPTAPNLVIKPVKPTTMSSLRCEITSPDIDEDGDPITFTYKWYKNGEFQSKYENKINIDPEDTTKKDEWKVEVMPSDPYGAGTMASTSVIIVNAKPSCKITLPIPTGDEYYDNEKISVFGEANDVDEDPPETVIWYLDLDNPSNVSSLSDTSRRIKEGSGANAENALNFKYKFSKGYHNLTLVVYDSESQSAGDPSMYTVTFRVKHGEGKEGTTETATMIAGGIIAIVVIVILLLLYIFLRKRKPVSEREKMYGTDKGLKPGEAYPVEEEKGDSYFGDELDRKGVSSLEQTTTTQQISTATPPEVPAAITAEKPATAAVEGKAQQPQLPPAKETDTEGKTT